MYHLIFHSRNGFRDFMFPVAGSLEDSRDILWLCLAMSPAQTVISYLCNHVGKNSDGFYSFISQVPHNCADPTSHRSLQRDSFLRPRGRHPEVSFPHDQALPCNLASPGGGAGAEVAIRVQPGACLWRIPDAAGSQVSLTSGLGPKGTGDLMVADTSAAGGLEHHNQNSLSTAYFIFFKTMCRRKDLRSKEKVLK